MDAVHTPAQTVAYRWNLHQDRLVKILTILGFAIPIAVYLWYLHHYGLNVVYGDQWDSVSLLGLSYKGKLTLSALWAQHNENRILFPNLIALALSRIAAFNVVIEQYVGAVFLFGSLGLIIGAHKRRCSNRTLLAYCPVVILMLSVVQGDNTLSGFQIAWYLILVTLAGVVFILDRETISSLSVLASIALAIVGSFSSVQGLFIWVAGLMLLYYRRRSLLYVLTWIGAAAGTAAVYFYNWNGGVPASFTALHLPSQAVQFFFRMIGDILGVPLTGNGVGADLVLVLGCLVVALAFYTLWSSGRRRDTESAVPVGLVLIVFGLLCALSTTYGRVSTGAVGAAASRYTTFDLLIVVGTYLVYIALPSDLDPSRRVPRRQVTVRTMVAALLGGVIVVQVLFGFVNGIRWARWDRQLLLTVAAITVDINKIPDVVVVELAPGYDPIELRDETRVLADHGLSFFAERQSIEYYRNQAAIDWRDGLFRGLILLLHPTTIVRAPQTGSVISGKTLLVASVRNVPYPRSVEFELTRNGGERILGAAHTPYGWILRWKSSTVPNGTYHLRSLVIGPAGQQTRSQPISITVNN